MTWVKLDDSFAEHPKVVQLSDKAFRLHVGAICYAGRLLTDGFVPLAFTRPHSGSVLELLDAGLWDREGSDFRIHDYLEFNPSKQTVEQNRSKRQANGRAGGRASASARREAKSNPVPVPVPRPEKAAFDFSDADDREAYFVQRLQELSDVWLEITPERLDLLNENLGLAEMRLALEHAWEERIIPKAPIAWLRTAAEAAYESRGSA